MGASVHHLTGLQDKYSFSQACHGAKAVCAQPYYNEWLKKYCSFIEKSIHSLDKDGGYKTIFPPAQSV